jgi:hypothetical protein
MPKCEVSSCSSLSIFPLAHPRKSGQAADIHFAGIIFFCGMFRCAKSTAFFLTG